MKIIRIWFGNLYRANYRWENDGSYTAGDDYDYEFYYSRADAMDAMHSRAKEFEDEWKYTQKYREYGACEVGNVWSILVSVKDDIVLPDDASDLILGDDDYNPLYLDCEHTDIAMEHEFPRIGTMYTLHEDGTITDEGRADDAVPQNHPMLNLWRERGWNGEITEVR